MGRDEQQRKDGIRFPLSSSSSRKGRLLFLPPHSPLCCFEASALRIPKIAGTGSAAAVVSQTEETADDGSFQRRKRSSSLCRICRLHNSCSNLAATIYRKEISSRLSKSRNGSRNFKGL